ncbi:MAG: fibronectin type III domain-containing protein, partial [Eubacterium sp.]|nr:fibronectin type III domain-containing protein [Eubacterium sp.]
AEWKTLAAKYRGLWDIPQPDVYANNEEMIFSEWSLEAGGELLSDTYFNDTTLSEDGLVFYANYTSREHADEVLQSMKEMAEATYEKSEQAQNAIAAAEEAYNGLMRGEKKAIQKDAEAYLQQAQEKADKLKQQEENPKTPSGNNNSGNSSSGSNSGSGTASGGQSGAGGKSGSASGAVNPYTTSSFGNYMSPVIIVNPLAATKFTSVKAGKAGSRKILLKWKKKKKIDGYQIQYSTKKSFKKGVKTINIKKAKTTKKTIKKLKKGRKYFVRIRTYKMINGTPFYGAWSNVKSVRVK